MYGAHSMIIDCHELSLRTTTWVNTHAVTEKPMASTTNEIDAETEETVATAGATNTGTGLDENVAGALSYLLGLVTGIVFYVIDDREFVRFHAAQSIAFNLVLIAAYIVLTVLQIVFSGIFLSGSTGGFILGSLVSLVLFLVWLVLFVGGFAAWLYMMYKAYNGTTPRVPLAAGIADRLV